MKFSLFILIIFLFFSCKYELTEPAGSSAYTKLDLIEPVGFSFHLEADSVYFAVIGDYGDGSEDERQVADLVKSYNPDFILSLGDNNCPDGKENTIVMNIGQFYCDYIYNFDAPINQQCKGKAYNDGLNRFFPCAGNHDYFNPNKNIPYLNYFTLPDNEVYYEFIWGPIHFYSLDSNIDTSDQHTWFNERLSLSEQPFNIVFFHHSPYSSGKHGNEPKMQWDFSGIDLVLSGHDHIYQRITKINEDFPIYIVNGLGGQSVRECNVIPLDAQEFINYCYDGNFGTMVIASNDSIMKVQFIALGNIVIDSFTINKTNL